MFGNASRIEMRRLSADFCAIAGVASRAAATIVTPSLNCTRILTSIRISRATHALCQVALYHSLAAADHGLRRHTAAALDRDAAARMKPAARRDIGRIGHDIAKTDIRHATPRLRRQYAVEQRLRIGMTRREEQRIGF